MTGTNDDGFGDNDRHDELARRMRAAFDDAKPSAHAARMVAVAALGNKQESASLLDVFATSFWKLAAAVALPLAIAAAVVPFIASQSAAEVATLAMLDGDAAATSSSTSSADLSSLFLGESP
jgi:hypothetical protein